LITNPLRSFFASFNISLSLFCVNFLKALVWLSHKASSKPKISSPDLNIIK